LLPSSFAHNEAKKSATFYDNYHKILKENGNKISPLKREVKKKNEQERDQKK